VKPLSSATDALFWRATILCEILDGLKNAPQVEEPLKRLQYALEDYEAAKGYVNGVAQGGGASLPAAPHQDTKSVQLELEP
jgi:hypothetical protein